MWGFGVDDIVESRVISHEMGHLLGLYHTEHGTYESGGCCELVADYGNTDPNSSSCMCGDFVPDTPADIGTNPSNNNNNCQWIVPSYPLNVNCTFGSYPNFVDANGDPYQPTATNIMSSTNDYLECTTIFTSGQGRRMRYFLETEQILQNSNVSPQISNPEIYGVVFWTTANTPNNGDFLIDGNLTIKSGSLLSIQSGVTVHFGENSKVIIEPSAQLELRGTLTSNSCGEFWQGVEVWGNSGQPQWPGISAFPALYPQGYFRGWYGGVIENAVTAVQLSGPTGNGGVITCTGTTIRNSVRGIVFEPHQNFLAPFNTPLGYIGAIQNSIFEVDEDYPHQTPFHSFIHMTEVYGPRISHCSFTNNIAYSIFVPTEAEDHGYGIFADGAGFTLNNSSEFNRLGYGVYVGTSGSQFPFVIEDCTFDQCIVGIRNREVHGATILSNTFNMGVKPNLYFGDQFGICFEEGITSFTCQENSFINTAGNNYHDLIGIFCKNTGDFSKTIRRNNFVGLDFGNLSNGTNGNTSLQFPRGLNYLCNTNFNVSGSTDFAVADGRIRPIQGLPNANTAGGYDATGNTFSYTGTDFNNMGDGIAYFFNLNGLSEEPLTFSGNITLNQALPNMCPSDFIERPPLDTQIVDNIKQQYHDTKEAYSELMPTYQSHPTDAMANTLSLYRQEMDEAAYKIALHIKSDTLSPYYPDSLYAWIGNLENYEGDLWLAREYLAAGSPTLAAQVFNGIPSKYTLTTAQQSDLNNYAAIANLIGTTSVYELDATALTALRSYDNVGGHAEGWAQNILTWYGAHYPVEYVTSSQGEQQLIGNGQIRFQQDAVSSFKVAVFPNPANQVVNFAVEGDLSEKGEVLVVKDMHNRILTKFMVTSSESNISWDSSIYPSGLYFFQLYSNGKSIEAGKIILNK